MGRPVYQYELADPDFSWLVSSFQENHPDYSFAETTTLPVVFIQVSGGIAVRPKLGCEEELERPINNDEQHGHTDNDEH